MRTVKRFAAALAAAAIVGTCLPSIHADDTARGKTDTLHLAYYYLLDRAATRIEDLSDRDILATLRLPTAKNWQKQMVKLARVEAGTRGLTNDAFSYGLGPPASPRPAMAATAAEVEILARIVKGETWWDTPRAGRVAVASVVLNRVRARGFPKTIAGVALQPWQFSCYNADVRHYLYYGPIPSSAIEAARAALAGEDPCWGATFYFNPYIVQPNWARTVHYIKRIGTNPLNTHEFYR